MDDPTSVAYAIEELRLAEMRLDRRRETASKPSATERAVLRHTFERSDAGDPATPSDLADYVGLSRSAISIMLRRLERQGLVRTLRHPGDGRRRVVMPVSRNDHLGGDNLLTDRIREVTRRLTDEQAAFVTDLLEELREVVDRTEVTSGDPS